MIFQEPMTSLNPVYPVGRQVQEAILLHQKVSKAEASRQVIEIFKEVGIPEPEKRYNSYPHQLSGGLRQRVMIGMAMVCKPNVMIADEPTTALGRHHRGADTASDETPAGRTGNIHYPDNPQYGSGGRSV